MKNRRAKRLFLTILIVGIGIGFTHQACGNKITAAIGNMLNNIAGLGLSSYYAFTWPYNLKKTEESIKTLIHNKAEKIALLQQKYPQLDHNWRNLDFEREIQEKYAYYTSIAKQSSEKIYELRLLQESLLALEKSWTARGNELMSDIRALSSDTARTVLAKHKKLIEEYDELTQKANKIDAEWYGLPSTIYLEKEWKQLVEDYYLLILSFVAKDFKAYEAYIKQSKQELFEQNKEAWLSLFTSVGLKKIYSFVSPAIKTDWYTFDMIFHWIDSYEESEYIEKKIDPLVKDWNVIPIFDEFYSGDNAAYLNDLWCYVYVEPTRS